VVTGSSDPLDVLEKALELPAAAGYAVNAAVGPESGATAIPDGSSPAGTVAGDAGESIPPEPTEYCETVPVLSELA
jgi:hypothetical protein